jgi:hypothetical protein
MVADSRGVRANQRRLYTLMEEKDKPLDDSKTLASFKLPAGSTLHFLERAIPIKVGIQATYPVALYRVVSCCIVLYRAHLHAFSPLLVGRTSNQNRIVCGVLDDDCERNCLHHLPIDWSRS